ncbi:tRNA intron endonuclease [Colletotrichum orchidophilum]|uniref:tRNA-intron lyase n=1 Tax=Colletotrichum orchidophilum TaxID=1209926 RepID=A0A1G4BK16_9PEZI|nr:tRNA intron endonuclease [Colletotrichum orchidophilum]OHF01764.1 tRNA intron endonuclease [Colletotrichum orchidophilum]
MSQTKTTASQPAQAPMPAQNSSNSTTTSRPRGPPLHKIYELPAPIRTFPLPSFYPNNPISLFHVLFAWTKQALFPPPAEPSIVHEGIWSPESKSVNIIDEKSMRALWEQGFYGKGNLSRSEPNWFKREHVRRGLVPGQVSELVTASRREERRQMKWERAKTEQEAIRQLRIQEAQLATQVSAADGAVRPPALAAEADAIVDATNNHVPEREASTDADILPEPLISIKSALAAESNHVQTNGVDTIAVAPVAETEVVDQMTGEPSTFQGTSTPDVEPAKIVKPRDFLQSAQEPEAFIQTDNTLPSDELPPASVPLVWSAPVGPLELLCLPNSHIRLPATENQVRAGGFSGGAQRVNGHCEPVGSKDVDWGSFKLQPGELFVSGISTTSGTASPVGPLELLALPNAELHVTNGTSNGTHTAATGTIESPVADNFSTAAQKLSTIHEDRGSNGHLINDLITNVNGDKTPLQNGLNGVVKSVVASGEIPSTPKSAKRRKSVRFSPKVESATYQLSDPPSPSLALFNGTNGKAIPPVNGTSLGPGVLEADAEDATASNDVHMLEKLPEVPAEPVEVINKEHLQLTSEEAFFLAFGMGALRVIDPATRASIPTAELFDLFRQYSYFPRRATEELQPDDGFLVNYVVYHHFRSLGWVPRAGIKFGVDWMLYAKGPVFDHAEFGAILLPSYSHQWWKDSDRQLPRKTWHWLHGVVRVLSHVQKSLVLVYVDVPPPPQFEQAMKKGPAEVFKLYKIREVMVKRWSSNRNR